MASYTIPETVLGIPLWVPAQYDFFQIDEDALPNGDSCLVVNGAVSDQYKAFLLAPTWVQDILNQGDCVVGRQFAMSCWLKLDLITPPLLTDTVMMGCSAYESGSPFNGTSNAGFPFVFGQINGSPTGVTMKRECLNNVASPAGAKIVQITSSYSTRRNRWFLYVFNLIQNGGPGAWNALGTTYLDSHPEAIGSDDANGSNPSGSFLPRKYLHIGAYHNGGKGLPITWRIAKWAFHSRILTDAERKAMWNEMHGGPPYVYTDNFNRASLGDNWAQSGGSGSFSISGDRITTPVSFATCAMQWVYDLGSPNHYSQAKVITPFGQHVQVAVRMGAYASNAGYSGGWDVGNSVWKIDRHISQIASVAGSAPSSGDTIRLEVTTDGSNNAVLNLYNNGVLKLTYTDSSASKILTAQNAGLFPRGNTGNAANMDDFECGTL